VRWWALGKKKQSLAFFLQVWQGRARPAGLGWVRRAIAQQFVSQPAPVGNSRGDRVHVRLRRGKHSTECPAGRVSKKSCNSRGWPEPPEEALTTHRLASRNRLVLCVLFLELLGGARRARPAARKPGAGRSSFRQPLPADLSSFADQDADPVFSVDGKSGRVSCCKSSAAEPAGSRSSGDFSGSGNSSNCFKRAFVERPISATGLAGSYELGKIVSNSEPPPATGPGAQKSLPSTAVFRSGTKGGRGHPVDPRTLPDRGPSQFP